MVLLYVVWGVGPSGHFVSNYKNEIQSVMNQLAPGYNLEEVDLSEFIALR